MQVRGLVICELRNCCCWYLIRTANWRTGNMRTKMRTRPLIGRDVTRVQRAVCKVPHGVRSSHCFVSRPNEPYCSIAESRCICIFMTTVFLALFNSNTLMMLWWLKGCMGQRFCNAVVKPPLGTARAA